MNSFGARSTLTVDAQAYEIYRLAALAPAGDTLARLPFALRVLLENLLRHEDGQTVTADDIRALLAWRPDARPDREIAFTPARVLLHDLTGVPALADLAAMRDAVAAAGGDPSGINPRLPVDLVIDHSVQVDSYGSANALAINVAYEYERNHERYAFLRWGQQAFQNLRVVPPGAGIVHQVNLEHLARVVWTAPAPGADPAGLPQAYPDTVIGTDSHTPMVNGLGVLGWGVGGIEAEAALLGQPIAMLIPQVVGVRLGGDLPDGATATDLVLTLTAQLRAHGVVGQFVEFYGPGLAALSVADRATLANMAPEYGATCAFFPIDAATLDYLQLTGRSPAQVALVEAYTRAQGLFYTPDALVPAYSSTLDLDLGSVQPSVAGPRRPQDRVALGEVADRFRREVAPPSTPVTVQLEQGAYTLDHGAVVLAAITSCTNTSNPAVMIAAGLLAQKAVARGLRTQPWVKTSLAPGSRVVTAYLDAAGLTPALEALRFHTVGYGCTTCIGNAGLLPPPISAAIEEAHLVACAVLSGNRNFEGRISQEVRANYLMSPPLVVAYALAGRIDLDLEHEPLGTDPAGMPVYLRDLWPSRQEIQACLVHAVQAAMFRQSYAGIFEGDARWQAIPVPTGAQFAWKPDSTYVRRPPFFVDLPHDAPAAVPDLVGARVLAILGDSVTTDHISPAGSIRKTSPAGEYLRAQGIAVADFNIYGTRRGNHEVLVRGTFANVRLRNQLAPGTEGGVTTYLGTPAGPGEVLSIYEAARRYAAAAVPLIVLAGQEYGTGSSRDWAAKGPHLLGVRAVIAESYERIHRSNLIGMGILPLEFLPGESTASLSLSGQETYTIPDLVPAGAAFTPGRILLVEARHADGTIRTFQVRVRLDTPQEARYYRHGGILPYVLRQFLATSDEITPPTAVPAGA